MTEDEWRMQHPGSASDPIPRADQLSRSQYHAAEMERVTRERDALRPLAAATKERAEAVALLDEAYHLLRRLANWDAHDLTPITPEARAFVDRIDAGKEKP